MKCDLCDSEAVVFLSRGERGVLVPVNLCNKHASTPAGGAKFDQGKVRPSLILHGFPRAIEAVAEVGMYGLTLHEEGSWKDVPNGLQRYRDALQRHLLKHATEGTAKDSGLWHEAHLAWNALAVLELRMMELDKATGEAE